MKRDILVVASTFPRCENDSEPRFVYDLACQLSKNYRVTVLVPAHPDSLLKEVMGDVNIVRYRYAPFRFMETLTYPGSIMGRLQENKLRYLLIPLLFWGLYRSLRKELKVNKYVCVHVHWLIPQGLIQLLFSGTGFPPYVVTAHGGDVTSLNWGIFRLLKKKVVNSAAKATIVSGKLRDTLCETCEIDSSKMQVISMGCYTDKFRPTTIDKTYNNTNIKSTKILFVGRLAEKKGLEYLLEALSIYPLKDTDSTLLIVGDGPLKWKILESIKTMGLESRVKLLGALNHDCLSSVYNSADIFCAPSIIASDGDMEGLPTVIIEASSCGLPVVSTKVSGIPEVVVNNKSGFLVDEKDASALSHSLYKLVVNPSLRKSMGEYGRHYVKKFDWNIIGKRYAEIIDEAINLKKGGYHGS